MMLLQALSVVCKKDGHNLKPVNHTVMFWFESIGL